MKNAYANQLHSDTQHNLIANGGFEEGLEGWKTHNQGDYEQWAGLAEFSVENGELKVEIKQVGWAWWHIQLYQEPVNVAAGTYKISFDMRSDVERTVYVELTGSGVARQDFVVNNTMRTYEAIIEVPSDGSYKFMFGLGREPNEEILNTPYNIFIDNVKLIMVEEVEEPEEPGEPKEPGEPGESEEPEEPEGPGEPGGSEKPEEPDEPEELGDGENDVSEDKNEGIVKTGSWLDFRTLVLVGILLFLMGGALTLKRDVKNKGIIKRIIIQKLKNMI